MDRTDLLQQIDTTFWNTHEGDIYRTVINDTEKILIEKALQKARGNQIVASRILGLNRNTLRSKIKQLKINIESFKQ